MIDQLFMDSVFESTYSWVFNPMFKCLMETLCFIMARILNPKRVGDALYFYYNVFASVTISFSILYGGVFLSRIVIF
jgi:hypothetical protein